jgi:hypothetical protein
MKTTVEMPDALFRKATATAAERGIPLKDLLADALREHLRRTAEGAPPNQPDRPAWMSAFGGLRHLNKEAKRINHILEQEFEKIEVDEWR